MRSAPTVTGSRRADLVLLLVLAVALLAIAPGFRVYHSVTVAEVTGVRVDAAGRREPIAVPVELTKAPPLPPSRLLARLEPMIRAHTRVLGAEPGTAGDTRFEWTIRYSPNSLRLDRERVLIVGPDGRPR